MFRRLAIVATTAGIALAMVAAPASAATGTRDASSVRVSGTSAATGHAVTPDSTAIYWGISAYKCGGGVIGAQSRQAKNGPAVNKLVSTHQLQRKSGSLWRTVASRSFVKFSPANGVWYYAPGPSTRLDWTPATAGTYRINVLFKYYKGSTLVAKRSLNTAQVTGTVCVFS